MIPLIIRYWKPLAAVALLIALIVGYNLWAGHQQQIGEDRATIKYNALLTAQKVAAAEKLATETAKARAIEQSLAVALNNQEVSDAKNKKTTVALNNRLRDLAGPAGRLRDPNGDCGGSGRGSEAATAATSVNSANNGTKTAGLLSAELTELLRRLTAEADEINLAYASARVYGEALRAACSDNVGR